MADHGLAILGNFDPNVVTSHGRFNPRENGTRASDDEEEHEPTEQTRDMRTHTHPGRPIAPFRPNFQRVRLVLRYGRALVVVARLEFDDVAQHGQILDEFGGQPEFPNRLGGVTCLDSKEVRRRNSPPVGDGFT